MGAVRSCADKKVSVRGTGVGTVDGMKAVGVLGVPHNAVGTVTVDRNASGTVCCTAIAFAGLAVLGC